jgi:PAS domain S-box-containing protein
MAKKETKTSTPDMRVLFLSLHTRSRSRMAGAFAEARHAEGVEVVAAGLEGGEAHPAAVRVMGEAGIDVSKRPACRLDELNGRVFDVVIMLGDDAAAACPVLAGLPLHVNWNLPDPADMQGDEDTVLDAFRQTRDTVQRLVNDLFARGYLGALVHAHRCEAMLLDHVSDGIIAHDLQRRIFYFNRAAREITGYDWDDAVNRDCHDVFPGNFCGEKCMFCESVPPDFEFVERELPIVTKSGEERLIHMAVRPLRREDGTRVGVVVSFQDKTRETQLARRMGEEHSFSGIVGRDVKMREIFELIRDLARSDVPVLVQGESGTGKELVAAAIHNEGPRAAKLFVPVNCGALPETLLESELFGHVRGAFTGAVRDKKGRFELADGGTIFLDEIGDISPAMQVKLMRVLQEGTFERVGSEQTLKVNVRVISATNKDLAEEIAAGRFREDLYYRLSVVPLWLPPLRDRRNDIPLLADHVLKRAMRDNGRRDMQIAAEAMDTLISYDWPGNVRELQNWIQFALVKCKNTVIRPEHLPPPAAGISRAPSQNRRRKLDIESVRAALRETRGNKVEAARRLNVSRATLYRFLDEVGDAVR